MINLIEFIFTGGWWVCVDPPAKKPRILKGSPVRVNPIYEHLYHSNT